MLKVISRALIGLFMAGAGVMHFVDPRPFTKIVPSFLPSPLVLVYISGLFEVLGGVGLWLPRVRCIAGWGLLALLLAVFPANIYMAVYSISPNDNPIPAWVLWTRLPLQFVLMAWIYWAAGLSQKRSKS